MSTWEMPGDFLLIMVFIPHCEFSRIFGVFDVNSKSHFQMFEPLLKTLAARGHEVVVANHFPQKTKVTNYTDIDISQSLLSIVDNVNVSYFSHMNVFQIADFIWNFTRINGESVMKHPKVQALLNSDEKFDLVITEIVGSEYAAGFSYKFKAPLIGMVTCIPFPWIHQRLGNPDHSAYIPSYFVPYNSRMNFYQRLMNTLYNVGLIVGNHFFNEIPTNALLKKYFGDGVPTVDKVGTNMSLILVNSHFSITEPRPTVPGYIEVAGLHLQQPKPLPDDIQKFLDEAEHGAVYFSLGSLVQIQSMTPEKLKALLDAFAALPERVLMKYTGDELPGKPENVMIGKWLPQLDLLCHPKVKVFISHGGLMGYQELVYAGVPIVGIPLFADQKLNIAKLEALGMAIRLDYKDFNKENILRAVRTVIDNKSYSENAKAVSALFKDRPMTALDTAVYWVEYVIRHRGAPHLRSAAADMPLYQYLLLDVIGVLLLVAVTSVYTLYYLIKTVLRTLIGRKHAVLSHNKQHEWLKPAMSNSLKKYL